MSMMKGFSNAFRIPGLRKKIFITLGLVIVCRVVSQIPTPGINWTALQELKDALRAMMTSSDAGSNFFGWFETFTGGGLSQCAIGTLSIWPYISAQIVIQLLSSVIPSLEKLKKEGESGRQQLSQITRYLTIVLCVFQAWGISTVLLHPEMLGLPNGMGAGLVPAGTNPVMFSLMTVICMTTASLFVMWVADQITTFGVGNGASLIIMINITSRLPAALGYMWRTYFGDATAGGPHRSYAELAILIGFFLIVVMGTVMLTQGVRKIAIHSTRRSVGGGSTYGMQQTFMPLRVNYTGVMPIIFAQPILQVLGWVLTKLSSDGGFIHQVGESLTGARSTSYLVIYAALILFFTFFWVATQFNAIDISDNLKRDGSYIPGIRPGRATAEYLDAAMTRITLIGGSGLLLLALVPMILLNTIVDSQAMASFFGGTSLLIIVGVALDTLRIMESHLLVRKYEGFLSHGTLHGRGGV